MPDPSQNRIAALEAELAALRAEMQDYSYTVSHDLRASLRHILSYTQLVKEDAGPILSQETRSFLDTISDSARHMGAQMDGLMELSRMGTVEMQITEVALPELVQEVLAELQRNAAPRSVEWQVEPDLPSVLADATLLRASLHCVLDNALKFTAHRPQARISIAALINNGLVTLMVQDNGAGFNPALQSKLFHPFQRLHTTRQFPGLGVGLAMTHKMLRRMGGSVRAEAALDAGCTLSLNLPAAAP